MSWHTHVEVRGQLGIIFFFLLSCGSLGSNSDCEAWQQAPLAIEPSHRPLLPLSPEEILSGNSHLALLQFWVNSISMCGEDVEAVAEELDGV